MSLDDRITEVVRALRGANIDAYPGGSMIYDENGIKLSAGGTVSPVTSDIVVVSILSANHEYGMTCQTGVLTQIETRVLTPTPSHRFSMMESVSAAMPNLYRSILQRDLERFSGDLFATITWWQTWRT